VGGKALGVEIADFMARQNHFLRQILQRRHNCSFRNQLGLQLVNLLPARFGGSH
jgi:hypothetical protein